jgi:hypothetical protein
VSDSESVPRALIENVRLGYMIATYGGEPIGPDELALVLEAEPAEFETGVRFKMTAAGEQHVEGMIGRDR